MLMRSCAALLLCLLVVPVTSRANAAASSLASDHLNPALALRDPPVALTVIIWINTALGTWGASIQGIPDCSPHPTVVMMPCGGNPATDLSDVTYLFNYDKDNHCDSAAGEGLSPPYPCGVCLSFATVCGTVVTGTGNVTITCQ